MDFFSTSTVLLVMPDPFAKPMTIMAEIGKILCDDDVLCTASHDEY